ncbi:MAG TPA: ABC transporter substrate-binding protein [Anaerolineales bacterium]|nr:ABC transporter substrate-binding protein [Anaerolineales bacterium]
MKKVKSLGQALLGLAVLWFSVGCEPSPTRTVKIGLVAPFEGLYRSVGYDVVFAMRLALQEYNAQRPAGSPFVELVSLDDQADPTLAQEQARSLAADAQVQVVLGHWLPETTQAAIPIYQQAQLLLVSTAILPDSTPQAFVQPALPDALSLADSAQQYATAHGLAGVAFSNAGWYELAAAMHATPQTHWFANVFASYPDAQALWAKNPPYVLQARLTANTPHFPSDFAQRYQDLAGNPPSALAGFIYQLVWQIAPQLRHERASQLEILPVEWAWVDGK